MLSLSIAALHSVTSFFNVSLALYIIINIY